MKMMEEEADLGVAFLLVGAGELAAAGVAGEGLFARVRPYVRRQVIGAREAAHANAALERFLPCSFHQSIKENNQINHIKSDSVNPFHQCRTVSTCRSRAKKTDSFARNEQLRR